MPPRYFAQRRACSRGAESQARPGPPEAGRRTKGGSPPRGKKTLPGCREPSAAQRTWQAEQREKPGGGESRAEQTWGEAHGETTAERALGPLCVEANAPGR